MCRELPYAFLPQAISSVIGIRAMGQRFNVLMTIQADRAVAFVLAANDAHMGVAINLGVLFWGPSLHAGSYDSGSILGAPACWKLPYACGAK